MRMMLFVCPLCIGFGIGHIVGYNRGSSDKCPKRPEDLSVALKGCELAASEINKQLFRCEHKLSLTEEARIECVEEIKAFFIQPSGETTRKQ